jgi:hypothetical protein
MTDFPTLRAAYYADLAYAKRWEVVVQHERFTILSLDGVYHLSIFVSA